MAIYGTLDACAAQVGDRPHFGPAIGFLKAVLDGSHPAARTIRELPQGQLERLDLAGEGGRDAYALLQHPTTRARADQFAESHREYADIQAVIDGDEILEVMPLQGLETTQPYSAEKDVALYRMPADGSKLILRPGLAAILFPEDGHAPLQAPQGTPAPSRRIVVKVRLA
jgi:biofilm protein TabA